MVLAWGGRYDGTGPGRQGQRPVSWPPRIAPRAGNEARLERACQAALDAGQVFVLVRHHQSDVHGRGTMILSSAAAAGNLDVTSHAKQPMKKADAIRPETALFKCGSCRSRGFA